MKKKRISGYLRQENNTLRPKFTTIQDIRKQQKSKLSDNHKSIGSNIMTLHRKNIDVDTTTTNGINHTVLIRDATTPFALKITTSIGHQ